MLLPASLYAIARLLPAPLYVVGGRVRNQLAYGEPKGTDVDVCSALTPQEIKTVLAETPVKVVDVNPRIGTLLLTLNGDGYEYTAFRKDSYPLGGVHTPDTVTFVRDIVEDACRRDFTCNAVYWDVARGVVVDPLGGAEDIRNRLIRTTRTPQEVFGEDGLRILRLVRLAARLGWDIEKETLSVAYEMRSMLADISRERRREELNAILVADQAYGNGDGPERGLRLLTDLRLWTYLTGHEPAPALRQAACRIDGDWDIRLAALLSDRTERQLTEILGNNGLRYSNRQARMIEQWIALCQRALSDDSPSLVAAQCDDETGKGVRCLLQAFGHDDVAQKLGEARERLLEAGVALLPTHLPVDCEILTRLGIPDRELGKTLRYILEQGILQERALTKEECVALAIRYKEEHLC